MANKFQMNFSVSSWLPSKVVQLGTVGETVWSLIPSYDVSGNGCVDIFRSRSSGEVLIDVRVWNQGREKLSEIGHPLSDGQKSTQLSFTVKPHNPNKSFDGYVTVHYNVKCACALASKQEAVTQTENSIFSPHSANDFLHLLNNPDSFSDATVVCGSVKILVHRVILSARSPVFAAMFKTQMQEGRDGVVHIVDMEPDVLQAMLRYVYSGKTDHLTCSLAGDLLFAADKYQLEGLKLICVEALIAGIAANNVFRSLVLGDLHNHILKEHAVEFICKCTHFSDLEKTEEWQSLLIDCPSLAMEVLTSLVKRVQEKLSLCQGMYPEITKYW